eukprot:COSAG03_NODE_2583_length_2622_cov_1.142687_2_plen_98_part_00
MILPQKFITDMAMPIATWSASRGLSLSAAVSEVTDVAMVEGSQRGAPRRSAPRAAARGASTTGTMETVGDMRGRPASRPGVRDRSRRGLRALYVHKV